MAIMGGISMNDRFDRQKLYELLRSIPYGRVATYGGLAVLLGNRKWARAVGNALHDNPDGETYPCYKVVNSRGDLSRAYAFGGIAEQKRRLEAEGIVVTDNRVDLMQYGVQ
jgi:O-6-methylguanine DNA methyltransferase